MYFSLKIHCRLPLRLDVGIVGILDLLFLHCSVEFLLLLSLGALPSRGGKFFAALDVSATKICPATTTAWT